MLLSFIASIIFQITYKTQNLVKCQGILSTKTQSIRKLDRKIYQTKHLSEGEEEEACDEYGQELEDDGEVAYGDQGLSIVVHDMLSYTHKIFFISYSLTTIIYAI